VCVYEDDDLDDSNVSSSLKVLGECVYVCACACVCVCVCACENVCA